MSDDIERIARVLFAQDTHRLSDALWSEALEADKDTYRAAADLTVKRVARLGLTASDLAGLAEGTHVVVPVDLIWRLDDALSLYEDPIEYDRASFSGGDGNIVVPDRYDEIGFGDTAANVRGMIPETVRGAISRWLDKIIAARPGAKDEAK